MPQKLREIIVSKEDAVFWMDKNGVWRNEHGKFEHPRIIKYFNSAIRKDEKGYHVHQQTQTCIEKVYFHHEDTALFVMDIKPDDANHLLLNTGETILLDPSRLFLKADNLYLQTPEHWIKFMERALLKMSRFMAEKEGQLYFTLHGKTHLVQSDTAV